MSEHNPPIPWAGVIIINNRRLLVLKEKDKPFYLVPGGKVNRGETKKQAAIREVREELGVSTYDLLPLTTIYEKSKSTGQNIRFDVFTGKLDKEPDINNLPGKTEAIARIDSSHEQEGIEVGNLLIRLLPLLVKKDMIN